MAKRRDSQKSGLAGEFFVAAELLKRELQVSLTLGNAKAIDLFAHSEATGKSYQVQVKTLRSSNCYLLRVQDVSPNYVYVFVVLHKPGQPVEFFLLTGQEIIENEGALYGGGNGRHTMSGILMRPLRPYKDRWHLCQ